MHRHHYKAGDPIIYRMTKHSVSPGPRAINRQPAPHGEMYSYEVDKFWVVDQVLDQDKLLLRTRKGKTHIISADDRNLRSPSWWERIIYGARFRQLNQEG